MINIIYILQSWARRETGASCHKLSGFVKQIMFCLHNAKLYHRDYYILLYAAKAVFIWLKVQVKQ